MDDRKSCSAFVEKERKVTCFQKDKSKNLERSRREELLNKLKNLRPKYTPEVYSNEDDCITEVFSRKLVKPKKMCYLDRRTSNSRSERTKMSIAKSGRVLYKEPPFYNRRNEVCDRSDGSSRSSNKMHCNCYDQRQGRHYSRRYFEKFQYGTNVKSLQAMSSSLDASPTRTKEEKLKSSFSTHKKRPCEKRANRNRTNLSCESLLVNHSPRTNIDYLRNDRKKNRHSFKKSDFQDFSYCQCSSESICSEDFEKQSWCFPINRKKVSKEKKRVPDKTPENQRFDCCCGEEEKVKAGSPYFSKCPGYRADSDYSENSDDFRSKCSQPKCKDSKHNCSKEDHDNCTEEQAVDEEEKECNHRSRDISQNNEDHVQSDYRRKEKYANNIRLQHRTPDLPPPDHCTKYGEHLTKVDSEYRLLSDKSKSMQSLREDTSLQKCKWSRCECKECPLLSKTWANIKSLGNGKESKILKGYNSLVMSKKFPNSPLNKKIDRQHPQAYSECQETLRSSPRKKMPNQESINHSKCSEKKELNLNKIKPDRDRRDCEKKSPQDKKIKTKKNPESNISYPRIVKPRGESCKNNLRKILIYPPHGEEGPPLTMYKKFSNIDCRVKGDETKGFRYKVTYKQKFVSPVWYPYDGASPFRRKEKTADYG